MALLKAVAPRGVGHTPRFRSRWWLALLPLLWWTAAQAAQPSKEYQIKAVFLYNFAQFVDWPPAAFPDTSTPLVIGVLGDDPFGPFLDEAVHDDRIGGRPLVVRRFRRVEDIDLCHVLFISHSEDGRLDHVLAGLKGRSILTVGDTDGFSQRGGMIRFLTENNKVRMRINVDAAKSAGLTISSKLLRPAEIVTGKKE